MEDTSVPRLSTSRKLRSSVARFLSLGTVSKPLRRRRGARCARDREVSREVTLTWQCAGVFAYLFACFSARLLACLFEQLCLLMLTALFNESNRAHRCRRGLVLLLNIIWNHGQADTLHSAGKLRTVETFGADSEYHSCHPGSHHN